MGSCQTRAQQVGCKISSGYVRGRPTAAPDRRIKVKTLKRCKEQRDKGWQNGSTERSDGSRGQMSSASGSFQRGVSGYGANCQSAAYVQGVCKGGCNDAQGSHDHRVPMSPRSRDKTASTCPHTISSTSSIVRFASTATHLSAPCLVLISFSISANCALTRVCISCVS